ncbi:hypothetical protein [Croceivirga thetidis]|uniref:SIMPL domain-containing protein n=1 Tax=Croceivirga thetidis TaxID=2721623 RepID=A0ABX1GUD8_9FLAO|nr:hypothetical protein [Croceivirga thetidis]NKI32666.1 hypothetical protein [Croceivirga thetidis]
MKAILTLIFGILISTSAMANTPAKEVKVSTISYGVELNIDIKKSDVKETEVARLYMYKNARVKKALSFKTKANKAKMA